MTVYLLHVSDDEYDSFWQVVGVYSSEQNALESWWKNYQLMWDTYKLEEMEVDV